MIIDTSALLAILFAEEGHERMIDAIVAASMRRVGAPTLVEAAAVMLARKGPQGEVALDALLQRLGIEVVPMSAEAAQHARRAYGRYGRGVGTPASLNYGDCLAYGVAVANAELLLYKGEDFSATDVERALY